MKIDFVIPWVDGSDIEWQKSKSLYTGAHFVENDVRYRDWGILKFWFRSVEEYAPWVNKIFFITCGQIPEWMNVKHPKLVLKNHLDYIPEEYLPTFSAHPIELNLHRISELSEKFVYFNDDMFINNCVVPEDFYFDNKPKLSAVLSAQTPMNVNDTFPHILCNNISILNRHFNKKQIIRQNIKKWFNLQYGKGVLKNVFHFFAYPCFSMLQNFHMPSPMLKSTFEMVWKLETEILHNTSMHKTRHPLDVNQYVMNYYDIGTGNFYPRNIKMGRYYELGRDSDSIYNDITMGTHKMICINDSIFADYDNEKKKLLEAFENRYPNKCSFEL